MTRTCGGRIRLLRCGGHAIEEVLGEKEPLAIERSQFHFDHALRRAIHREALRRTTFAVKVGSRSVEFSEPLKTRRVLEKSSIRRLSPQERESFGLELVVPFAGSAKARDRLRHACRNRCHRLTGTLSRRATPAAFAGSHPCSHRGLGDREGLEAPPGFEPGVEVLQTSALPLGDGAPQNGARARGRARDFESTVGAVRLRSFGATA